MEIRPAADADLDQVATIYAHEVRHGHATFDLEPPPREQWTAKLASDHPGDHFLVACEGDRVLGYAYSTAYRQRAAYTLTRETTVYLAHVIREVGHKFGRWIDVAWWQRSLGREE